MNDLLMGINSTAVTTGRIKLTSNGEQAKTVKVNILANSGGVCYPMFLGDATPVVFDFEGMRHRSSIPLDWEHDTTIGAINRFSVENGVLNCGGWIDLVDIGSVPVTAMVAQMFNGTPYEASIEAWPDDELSVEYLPDGVVATINNQQIVGPTYILREWTLKAVALVKFGADYGKTSVSIAASIKEKAKKEKGFVIRLSKKGKVMNKENDDNKVEDVTAVEASTVEVKPTEATVEAEPVEAKDVAESPVESAEVVETKAPEVQAKVEAEAKEAVEAPAEPEPIEVKSSATVEAKDSRAEYKAFKAKFNDKAGEYFEAGYSMAEAADKYMSYLATALANAEQRLSAIGSGGKEPIKFSDGNARDFKAKASNLIRIAGKKYDD